jgi:hypothetical protein
VTFLIVVAVCITVWACWDRFLEHRERVTWATRESPIVNMDHLDEQAVTEATRDHLTKATRDHLLRG